MNLVGDPQQQTEALIRDEQLSDAEWRVALGVARGLSNKEVAAELHLSVRTVENHIGKILAKKGFSNRVEIARHVLENRNT